MFIRTKGQMKIERFPKVASTAFAVGDLVAFNGAGQITPAVAGTTTGFVGICKKAVTAQDADYAANTPIEIDVAISTNDSEFEVDANGTIAASLVGTYKDIIGNAGQISNTVATNTHVVVTGLGSTTTKAKVRIHQNALSN